MTTRLETKTRDTATRLKALLLAGVVVPSMVLAPMTPSLAQMPEQGPRGGHEGGGPGMRGEGPRGGEGPRAPRGEGGGMRGEGGPRGEGGQRGEGGGMRGPRGEGGGGMRAEPGERRAPPAEHAPAAERPAKADRPAERPDHTEKSDRSPAARPDRAERPDRSDHGPATDKPARAAAPDRDERAQQRRDRRNEDREGQHGPRDDAPPRNDAGPGDRGPGERRMGGPGGRDRGPGDRGPAAPGDRGPGDRIGGPGDRGPGDRGPGDHRMGGPGVGPGAGPGDRGDQREDRRRGGLSPAGAAAIGAAAGFAGGFIAGNGARRLDDIRRDRREVREGDSTFIREPGRTIVEEGDRRFVVHDPNDRFRELGYRVNRERRGGDFVDTIVLPGGDAVLNFTTPDGRLLRRVRRGRDGREVVLFENVVRPLQEDIVVLPPPPLRIPRDRYVLDYGAAGAGAIYETLIAPPVAPPPRRYTLDQVLYSPTIRNYVRSVDINTINFDTASWVVPGDQTQKLVALADAINKAVDRDPNSVFLIEGYTDATGNSNDNLSLSDRRAQSVAAILTKDFRVPPENLTTQGYGDQNPKEDTAGPSAANRRVVVRNITQLLASGGAVPQ